jgi:hypothetical protein
VEHRRLAIAVDAQQRAAGLQTGEQVLRASGLGKGLIWSGWLPIECLKKAGPGCVVRRLISHESRGITQWMASGSAPDWISQIAASIAVLPAPRITKCLGRPPEGW